MMSSFTFRAALLLIISAGLTDGLARPLSRRSVLVAPAAALAIPAAVLMVLPPAVAATSSNGLPLSIAASGLRWADAKIGSGQALKVGTVASIDYSMASTGGRSPQLYSTKATGAPYRWTLGDGSTIKGIEEAILGDNNTIPPMLPGGIRRLVIPSGLAFESLAAPFAKCESGVGPIPPADNDFGAYNRWKQLYCNPRIPYQPDLVLDIKLYGKKTNQ